MLTVDDYSKIRLAHRDGASIRELARRFGWSRQAIRKALAYAEPVRYRRTTPAASILDPLKGVVEAILDDDVKQPRKQRHTAQRLFERLVAEHGYAGGYDQVRRYVKRRRDSGRETFLPIDHAAGERVECDFGHIHVDFPDGRKLTPVLLMTWSYSSRTFAVALASERTEAILDGMCRGFAFFECAPREVWWDNPRTVATEILQGRHRRLHERYRALASHFRFEPKFCMPAAATEKPHVENRVKQLQRRWATPIPQMKDLAALNEHLLRCCREDVARVVSGRTECIADRFAAERAAAAPLPERPFDPSIRRVAQVDKYQSVRFETNWYSVPRRAAYAAVTIKAFVDQVEIVHQDQVVARHERSYARHVRVLDPRHYLVTLARKPALLDHAAVYRDWRLPAEFEEGRRALEDRHGPRTGSRQFARLLLLLSKHSGALVAEAIRHCLARGRLDAASVELHAQRLAQRRAGGAESAHSSLAADSETAPAWARVTVSSPNLASFDDLLFQGDAYERDDATAPQDESEKLAVAHDGCGVRSLGPRGGDEQSRPPVVPAAVD